MDLLIDLLVVGGVLLAGYFVAWLLFNKNLYSEEKTTTAKVVKTSFVPEHGGTHIVPVFGQGGFNTAITDDHEDEQDIVVLRSKEIGSLELDNAELLELVEKGEEVEVTYQEKYTYWSWNPSEKSFDEYVTLRVKTKDGTEINV